MIRHRNLFLSAYGKLYAVEGAATPGVNSEDTVYRMSLARIDRTIGQLEGGAYIDRKRGGKWPLRLPGWDDKLVGIPPPPWPGPYPYMLSPRSSMRAADSEVRVCLYH